MNSELISVVVPVYNAAPYLRNCLDSIVSQKYTHLEIILIDDGSVDQSGAICDQYAENDLRIKVFHKQNEGVSKTRNMGLKAATGSFITFIDGDDTVDPDYIGLMYREMCKGDYDIVRLSWERCGINYTYDVDFDADGKKVIDESSVNNLKLFANIWGLFRRNTQVLFNEFLKNGEDSLFVIENFVKSKSRKMLLMNYPFYHYTVVLKSASDMLESDRFWAHQKFLKQVLCLKEFFPKIDFLVKKHEYTDYFALMCYMIDEKKDCVDGMNIKSVENHIRKLRKSGAQYDSFVMEVKYFLYRFRFVSIYKFLKHIQKWVVK